MFQNSSIMIGADPIALSVDTAETTSTFIATDSIMNISERLDSAEGGPSHQSNTIVNLADFHGRAPANLQNPYISASSDDDDSSSEDGGSGFLHRSNDSITDSETAMETLTGRKDTIIASKLRLLVIALFVSMCVWFPIVIYLTTRASEVDKFDSSFESKASKAIESMEFQLARKLGAVDSMRIAVTSFAQTSNESWPYVTVPDYDLRADSAKDLGGVITINLHPLVTFDERESWEDYSVENIQWLQEAQEREFLSESSRLLSADQRLLEAPDFSLGFSDRIFVMDENNESGFSIDESNGPYFPTWQNLPPAEKIINLNGNSLLPDSQEAVRILIDTGDAVLSRPYFINVNGTEDFLYEYYRVIIDDFMGQETNATGAVSLIYYPIFDGFDPKSRRIVGMFSSLISFEQFFLNVLPDSSDGKDTLVCVVSSDCGDEFTYKINGVQAEYLGASDLHDRNFDEMEVVYDFISVGESKTFSYDEKTVRLNEDYCPFSLKVYPHDDLRDRHLTNQPIIYAVSIALAVIFISAISLTYDYFVQRRMRRAVQSAKENRAIVSSLFPANVRDRLIREEEERKQAEEIQARRRSMSSKPSYEASSSRRNSNEGRRWSNEGRRFSNDKQKRRLSMDNVIADYFPFGSAVAGLTSMALAPAKLRLKFFLSNESNPGHSQEHQYPPPERDDEGLYVSQDSKPIADLFPNCTVLFADIQGFTAWSSEREPEQVFTLLQTIFQKFDSLARKRDVFKVETIGDCYVAVTGLPDPQQDHAVRMTKFARACLHKVTQVTKRLEVSLGPGTGDLRMRFGLNSGPVTAGVLRGEKSRFQLFGDTVNVASRLESTGQRNRIQISQSTAQLLIESGKENWILPREDLVHAKGKGSIQTYWVLTRRQPSTEGISFSRPRFVKSTLQDSSDNDGSASEGGSIWDEEEVDDREFSQIGGRGNYDRIIDWQVDMLLQLIKQVIAGRDLADSSSFHPGEAVTTVTPVCDEVSESIELPKFNPKAAGARIRPEAVEVPPVVVSELREFVKIIANRYRDNHFHNFAHANHVSMSAKKLLSRIVRPEDVDYRGKSVNAVASDLHDYTFGITSDPLCQLAIMISTLIHDVDHTGVSNLQRGKEDPALAEKYHNKSVAEQNSIDLAWEILMDPKFENLQRAMFATETEISRFRQLLVNVVMATDIFDKDQKSTRNMRWEKVFHSDLRDSLEEDEFRNLKAMIVIEHIIQAADVSHTMQHWQVYTRWNERLFREIYRAYEDGRAEKDPTEGWYNGELWFFDNYVIPLARKLEECGCFGVTTEECLNYALENRREWAVKGKEIVQGMAKRVKLPRKRSHLTPQSSLDSTCTDTGFFSRRSSTFVTAPGTIETIIGPKPINVNNSIDHEGNSDAYAVELKVSTTKKSNIVLTTINSDSMDDDDINDTYEVELNDCTTKTSNIDLSSVSSHDSKGDEGVNDTYEDDLNVIGDERIGAPDSTVGLTSSPILSSFSPTLKPKESMRKSQENISALDDDKSMAEEDIIFEV